MLAGSVPLVAEPADFGLQAGLAFPTDDLDSNVKAKTGYTLGAHVLVDLDHGHAFRPRLDYLNLPGGPVIGRVEQVAIGADYIYYLNGRVTEGAYLFAGLGLADNKLSGFQTQHKGLYAAGLGYQFSRTFGLEGRYAHSPYNGGNFNTVTVSGMFRF